MAAKRSNQQDRPSHQRAPINQNIRAQEVCLITHEGQMLGVVPLKQALDHALEAELDLVEVDAKADPPVCKIMDYGKYRYELSKQKNAAKKKQVQTQVKEVKFRPGTEEGDYQVKLRQLTRFLEQGNKAKVSLRYKGREKAHPELGLKLLNRVEKDLAELGIVEKPPARDTSGGGGRNANVVIMIIAPKKRK